MTSKNNPEVLKSYFSEKEIKELQEKKPDKYKELSEKLKLSQNKTQVELQKLKHELDNLTLNQKVDKLLGFFEKEKTTNSTVEKVKREVKNKAEKEWFSWDKIWDKVSKTVKEKWGWLSWSWFWAWVWVFFSSLISSLFNSAKKKVKETIKETKNYINDETEWKWVWNIYESEKWKLRVEKQQNWFVKEININWEKYFIEPQEKAQIKKVDWKDYLFVWDRKISLNHLWKIIDNLKGNLNVINFSTDKSITETLTSWLTPDLINEIKWFFSWNWEFKLVKEKFYWEIKENIVDNWITKIEFKEKIEWKKFPIKDLTIKEVTIYWKKYKIKPENQKFILKKENNKIILSVDMISEDFDFDDFKIDIRDIEKQINNQNKKENSKNEYYLFKPLIDTKYTKWIRPDIFLLEEIKS